MQLNRSIDEPIRHNLTFEEKWKSNDHGLICSWESGREIGKKDLDLKNQAVQGRLVVLPFKGGVEKSLKLKRKYGTLFYLAMWQGLRGEDLCIDISQETEVTCTETMVTVTFTNDHKKYTTA